MELIRVDFQLSGLYRVELEVFRVWSFRVNSRFLVVKHDTVYNTPLFKVPAQLESIATFIAHQLVIELICVNYLQLVVFQTIHYCMSIDCG